MARPLPDNGQKQARVPVISKEHKIADITMMAVGSPARKARSRGSSSLHHSDGRVAAYVPPAAKCAEGAHGSAGCICSGTLHFIPCNKKLTIRVQNVGQRNCTGLVGT